MRKMSKLEGMFDRFERMGYSDEEIMFALGDYYEKAQI